MIIKPVLDNIVVEIQKTEKDNKTQSGIILPKTQVETKQDQGKVVAVGTGRILNDGASLKPIVKEEDQILFNRFAGSEIEAEGKKFLIIKETDILAVIS